MNDVFLQQRCACIFCHEVIDAGALDPCALRVTAGIDQPRPSQKEQSFFCHIACLRAATHKAMLASFYIDGRNYSTIGEIEEAAIPSEQLNYLH